MKKEIADRWIDHLRFSNLPQTRGLLHRTEPGHEGPSEDLQPAGFCCLGVLCEIAADEGVVTRRRGAERVHYNMSVALLPDEVIDWADMHSTQGTLFSSPKARESLVDLNDNGKSFAEIADVIERHWETL